MCLYLHFWRARHDGGPQTWENRSLTSPNAPSPSFRGDRYRSCFCVDGCGCLSGTWTTLEGAEQTSPWRLLDRPTAWPSCPPSGSLFFYVPEDGVFAQKIAHRLLLVKIQTKRRILCPLLQKGLWRRVGGHARSSRCLGRAPRGVRASILFVSWWSCRQRSFHCWIQACASASSDTNWSPLGNNFLASVWHDDDVSTSICSLAMFEICDRLRFYEIVEWKRFNLFNGNDQNVLASASKNNRQLTAVYLNS